MDKLTKTQLIKWESFLESYSEFYTTSDIILTTADIGKALQCRPDHVVRQLSYISRGLEHKLQFQKMTRDSRNRFFKAETEDLRNMKGGRQRGCYKEKGLKGNAIYLRIWLDK